MKTHVDSLRAELAAVNDALDEFGAQHHQEPVTIAACVEDAMTTLRIRIANAERDGARERARAEAAEQVGCGLAFDLGRLQAVAAEAVCEFQDFIGQASTFDSARHALHRLGRWLETTGQRTFLRDPLWWRLVYFDSLEHAGFRTGEDEQVRKILPGQPAWQRAHGPTLAEEVERLRYDRDEVRERVSAAGEALWELERAASAFANSQGAISGALGGRLADAREVLGRLGMPRVEPGEVAQ